jgi:hypothetical protein
MAGAVNKVRRVLSIFSEVQDKFLRFVCLEKKNWNSMHPWFKRGDEFPVLGGQATRGYQDPPAPTRTDRPPTETYRGATETGALIEIPSTTNQTPEKSQSSISKLRKGIFNRG